MRGWKINSLTQDLFLLFILQRVSNHESDSSSVSQKTSTYKAGPYEGVGKLQKSWIVDMEIKLFRNFFLFLIFHRFF